MISNVYYDPRQSVEGLESYSRSAGKPDQFMAMLKHRYAGGIGQGGSTLNAPYPVDPLHFVTPVVPATREDLYLVHDKNYVDGVFAGTIDNGFENRDERVPESCLWTVGSLVTATLGARDNPDYPACSPTSGFHHAGYADGAGFCTFNGIMVAVAKYIDVHPNAKVGILDCDYHYGDGTDDILKLKRALAKRVIHRTSGEYFQDDVDPLDFFKWLNDSIEEINTFGCEVVIYQAGADMHVDDPLGGLLNDDEMAQRDRMVFRQIKAPVAWCLAGGYRGMGSVIETHLRTFAEACDAHDARAQWRRL